MARQQAKSKKRPTIPEPSPHFILWSAVIAALCSPALSFSAA